MRFSQSIINLQRLLCVSPGSGHCFPARKATQWEQVCVGQSGISKSVAWVDLNRLTKKLPCLFHPFCGSLVPKIAALDVKKPRVAVIGVALGQSILLFPREPQAQP